MKRRKQFVTIAFSILILSIVIFLVCGGITLLKKSLMKPTIQEVTIIHLIATPKKYDGKLVRVVGVGNLEFEENAIYLSKDDLSYRVYNAVWLDFDNNTTLSYAEAKKHNGKYVIVEGIFDKDHSGHMGLFHGAITNITRYELNLAEAELAETENVK